MGKVNFSRDLLRCVGYKAGNIEKTIIDCIVSDGVWMEYER